MAPSEVVNRRSQHLRGAVDHNRSTHAAEDCVTTICPFSTGMKHLKAYLLEQVRLGKPTTTAATQRGVDRTRSRPPHPGAMLNLISPDGKSIATTTKERAEMLAAFEIDLENQTIELPQSVGTSSMLNAKPRQEAEAAKGKGRRGN